jgi:hypothetical protein
MRRGKIYVLSIVLLLATVFVLATRQFTEGEFNIYVVGLSPYTLGSGSPTSNLTIGGLFGTQCKVIDVSDESFPLYFWPAPQSENVNEKVYPNGW